LFSSTITKTCSISGGAFSLKRVVGVQACVTWGVLVLGLSLDELLWHPGKLVERAVSTMAEISLFIIVVSLLE
jgi:hypothetical protein